MTLDDYEPTRRLLAFLSNKKRFRKLQDAKLDTWPFSLFKLEFAMAHNEFWEMKDKLDER